MVDLLANDVLGTQHVRAQGSHFFPNFIQPVVHRNLLGTEAIISTKREQIVKEI
jgi:hypothetical protein